MKTTFLAAAIVLGAVTLAHAQVPPGSYLQSCSNVRFDGRQLSAVCADRYGRRVPTSLMVGNCGSAISNVNGQLACEYGGGDGGRRRMQSRQFDDDGDYDRPRPRRDYGFRSGESRIPGGSWHGSCKNAQMQGPMLTTLCANTRGQFQQTTADTRSCRSFANRNGNLGCE
jgi:hypothetical protein